MSLLLLFTGGAAGPTTHQASVAFSGTGAASYTASLVIAASVAFGGTGTVAAQANQNHAASVAATGTGTFSATAQLRHAASVAFNGTGTFTATADSSAVTHPASVTFGGIGTFDANAALTHAASVAFEGAGTFTAAPETSDVHQGSVAFAGAGTFNASADLILAPAPQPHITGGTSDYGPSRVSAKRRAVWDKALAESLEKPDEPEKRPDKKPRRRPKGETPEERAERYRQLDALAKELRTQRLITRHVPEAEGLAEGTIEARSARMRSGGVRTFAEPGHSTLEGGAVMVSTGAVTYAFSGGASLDGVHNLTDEQLDALLLTI